MAANGIVRQRRGICLLLLDHAIRHQSQLDQCLETVADAKHQSVSFVQKRQQRLL